MGRVKMRGDRTADTEVRTVGAASKDMGWEFMEPKDGNSWDVGAERASRGESRVLDP
jgi:hypothetical protein